MAAGNALIATLVVAGKSCHVLLRIRTDRVYYLDQKSRGFSAAQGGGDPSLVSDVQRAISSDAVAETALIGILGQGKRHDSEVDSVCGLTFELTGPLRYVAKGPE
jgi:hypothetical protein